MGKSVLPDVTDAQLGKQPVRAVVSTNNGKQTSETSSNGLPDVSDADLGIKKKDGGSESTNGTSLNVQSSNGQNTPNTEDIQKAQTNVDNKQATPKDVSVLQKNADDLYSGNAFLNLKNNLDRKAFAASNNKLSPTEVVSGVQNIIQKHWDNINPIDVKKYARGEAMATQRNYIDNLTAKPNPADPNIQNEVNKNTPSVILNSSADAVVANREAKKNLLAKVQNGDIMATRDIKELTRKGIQDQIDFINNNPEGKDKTESVSGATVFAQSTSRQLSKAQQEEVNQLKQEQDGVDNIFEDYAKLNIVNDARKKPGGMYTPDNIIDAGRQMRLYRNGIGKFQDDEDIKDATAITYKNYYDEQAGLSALYDVQQSEYADVVKQHLLTDNPNLVADINMKGGLLEDTRNQLQNLSNKYQPVRLNYVARIMGDEISDMHPVSNVFITDNDRQEAVNKLDKKYPGFADKYKSEIAQLNNQTLGFLETKIPHQGFYGALTRGLATGGEELRRSALDLLGVRDRTDRAADEFTDAMNSYAAGTVQSGNAPNKIVVSDNGKTFEERENENYGTYNFNNSVNKVGAFVGGIIPFVVATEVGAAGAERIINGAAKLADVANSAAKVKRMSTLAEFGETDVLGGEAVLAASEGNNAWQLGARSKQMYGTAIGTYLMNYDANLKTADRLIDDDSGAGDSKKMLAANLLTLGQSAAFSALPPNVFARNLLMKGLEQDAVTILSKAGEEDILATGKKGIQSWLTNYVKPRVLNVAESLKNQGINIGKVNLEMLALNHSNATISNMFDETGATRNANVWHDDIETIKDMTLGSVAMAAMGFVGRGLVKSTVGGVKEGIPDMLNNAFSMTVRDALYDVASNPDQEVSRLRGMIDNGLIDREQGNGIIKIVKTAGKHFGEIIAAKNDEGNPLTIKQKAQKLSEMVRRDILNERKGEEHVDGKISETDNAITAIDGDNRYNSIRPVTDINGKITGYERVTPENITPAEEKRITSQLEPEKLTETQGIIDRINNKESINENEINNASTHLYDLWDKADEKTKNLIEPLIEKLENYDAKTKTETSTTTEEGAVTRVGTDVASKAVEKSLSQWDGSRAVIHNADGTTTEGTIGGNNLNFHVVDKDGKIIEDLGKKEDINKNISLPDAEEVPHPIQLDEDGNVKSITLQLNKVDERGDLVKDKQITVDFKDPEKALDYAIRLRAEQVGEFSEPEFEKIITEVSKEVPIESQNKITQNERVESENGESENAQSEGSNAQNSEGNKGVNEDEINKGAEAKTETTPISETTKTEQNAVQEQSAGEVLQRQQSEIRSTGSERERVEQGKQGEEVAGESKQKEEEIDEGGHSQFQSIIEGDVGKKKQPSMTKRALEAENISDKTKALIEKNEYLSISFNEARTAAQDIIKNVGQEESIRMAMRSDVHPSVRSAIFAENIDISAKKERDAKTDAEKDKYAQEWADLFNYYTREATTGGQFNSYIYKFYQESELGFQKAYTDKVNADINKRLEKDEANLKKSWDELMKDPYFKGEFDKAVEVAKKVKRDVKQENKKKIADAFDKLKIDTKGQASSFIIPPQIWNGAMEAIKQATLLGYDIADAIHEGIKHIKENYKEKFDEDELRKDMDAKIRPIIENNTTKKGNSKLDLLKKRLTKRIEDLNRQIDARKRDVKSKDKIELDDEAKLLIEERDRLNDVLDNTVGKRELTDEQKINMATKAVERSISEYERRIIEKDISNKVKKDKITTKELDSLRKRREELQKEYKAMKKEMVNSAIEYSKVPQEVKERILEKWEKRFVKLDETKRKELLVKVTDELMNNNALDYDTFKGLYAEALGMDKLTPEMETKLRVLGGKLNEVKITGEKLDKEATPENLAAFVVATKEGEIASRQLNDLLGERGITADKIFSITKLGTLGPLNLIMNPIYNAEFLPYRLTNGLVATALDYGLDASSISKNTSIKENVFYRNRGAFGAAWKELSKTKSNLIHGETSLDYFKNPVRANIRPVESFKSIVSHVKGENKLSHSELANAIVEALPFMGGNAAITSRLLQIGDSPFRVAAERGEAANIAKQKGLKGIEAMAFILRPDEASRERIIEAGERAVMQQSNLISDAFNGANLVADRWINAGLGGKTAGFATKFLLSVTQPFVKIPVNSAIATFELAMPEYTGMMAAIQTIRYQLEQDPIKKQELRRSAINYASKMATGIAIHAAFSSMAANNIITKAVDDKNKWKNSAYMQERTGIDVFNFSALKRLMVGESTEYQNGDIELGLAWLGMTGGLMQVYAAKYDDISPADKKAYDERQGKVEAAFSDISSRFSTSFVDGLKNSALGNTSALMQAMSGEKGAVDRYLVSATNVAANTFEPSWVAQLSKLQSKYKPELGAMSTSEKLATSLKDRFAFGHGEEMPSKINVWGEKVLDAPKGVNPYIYYYLDITKHQNVDTKDFGWNIAKLYMDTKSNAVIPSRPDATIRFNNESHRLTPKEWQELQMNVGGQRKELVQALMETDEWNSANNTEKIEMLKQQYKVGFKLGKSEFVQNNPQYDKSSIAEEE